MSTWIVTILLFAPLLGGLGAFIWKNSKLSIVGTSLTFIGSIFLLLSHTEVSASFEWLPTYEVSILIDHIALMLIALVALVSTMVQVFSLAYMKDDAGLDRYYCKLGFFTFSMIGLLIADHLILLFVFWELVGLASYLLIGFWYRKEGVPSSARLAFMVNRIADVSLLAGILMLDKSNHFISQSLQTWPVLPSILIAIGAFGKSAQLPFSGWLTKAMVGPTPVSALIHAATMVAAGVYLLFRVSPSLHETALVVIALVGTLTALYGGLCALMQHDIKRILAYSTISQLGYMIMGIGVGGAMASLLHLFTHAFFKAGLFLGAGAIIHFMHQVSHVDAQDMRNMGGLRSKLPWTYRSFLICALALAGLPLFSGFISKEGIIIAGWEWASTIGQWAYVVPDVALITAFLTALYIGRMVLLVFWGENRLNQAVDGFVESSAMKIPLLVMATGSLWFFYNWNPLAHESWLLSWVSDATLATDDFVSMIVTFLSLIMAFAGLMLAYSFFKPGSNYNQSYAQAKGGKYLFLIEGFYLTSAYQTFATGIEWIAKRSYQVDSRIVDGGIHFIAIGGVVFSKVIALIDRFIIDGPVNLIGYFSRLIGKALAGISSRDIQTQLAWLLVGVILILILTLFF